MQWKEITLYNVKLKYLGNGASEAGKEWYFYVLAAIQIENGRQNSKWLTKWKMVEMFKT